VGELWKLQRKRNPDPREAHSGSLGGLRSTSGRGTPAPENSGVGQKVRKDETFTSSAPYQKGTQQRK